MSARILNIDLATVWIDGRLYGFASADRRHDLRKFRAVPLHSAVPAPAPQAPQAGAGDPHTES